MDEAIVLTIAHPPRRRIARILNVIDDSRTVNLPISRMPRRETAPPTLLPEDVHRLRAAVRIQQTARREDIIKPDSQPAIKPAVCTGLPTAQI